MAPVTHRRGHVQNHHKVRVGVSFKQLDVVTVCPSEKPPVDPPNIIARHVCSVLRKVDAEAKMR